MTSYQPGEPCWIELFTTDTDRAKAFYGALFGWTASDSGPEYGGYITFERDGEPIAGMMHNDGSGGPSQWTVYLHSDDAAKTTDLARQHGAQVHLEPMQVGDQGHMAFLADPAGATVGVWQPQEHQGFAAAHGPVGAPTWFETLSHDYAKSTAFYRDVFGWDLHVMGDSDEFRYSTLGEDADAKAGIMDGSGFLGEQPSRWQFYVEVEDTDAAVAKAEAHGAKVVQAADYSPYGRLAFLEDPDGCLFAVVRSQQA